MPRQREQDNRQSRYHDVDSAETRAALRRNFYLMLAAAVGIALSFALSRMCPNQTESALDTQGEELRRNLEGALSDYMYDVKTIAAEGERIRCTVFVIAAEGIENPDDHVDDFEKIASGVFGDQAGEIVWRFYRQTQATAGGDPAFIGLHRSEIAGLAQKYGSGGENN